MFGRVRLLCTAMFAALALFALLPLHAVAVRRGGPRAGLYAVQWHRFVVRLMGIRVTVSGALTEARPLLLASNHISWLDIPVLASLAPVSFIAKSEVAGWPLFGWLARLQRSVFIDRTRRHATGPVVAEVAGRLSRGDILVLFAEGTSSDGNGVLPFRSALVGSAQQAIGTGEAAVLQPVALAYTRVLGLPLGHQDRRRIAWYGGMDLLPHLKTVLAHGAIDVHVAFGPPRRVAAGDNRKAATAEAELFVRRTVARLNAGLPPSGNPECPDQRTSTLRNCQGSLSSMSSGKKPGRSVSGVQSV